MRYLLLLLLLAGCSSSDNPPPVQDDAESSVQAIDANTAQVLYPGMLLTDYVPTADEVFITNNAYWICTFSNEAGVYWQTAFYMDADNRGRSVYNFGFDGYAVPDAFEFEWQGDTLSVSIFSDAVSVTFFEFVFETDHTVVEGDPIYQFVSRNSQGGMNLCNKNPGQWP